MDDAIDGRRTALYSVQPSYALSLGFPVPTDCYLRVEKQSINPCTALVDSA